MSQFEAFADSRQSCPFCAPTQSLNPLTLRYAGGRARFFLPSFGGRSLQNDPEKVFFNFL